MKNKPLIKQKDMGYTRESEEEFYTDFISYVRTNYYRVYCNAMEYASKSDED
tara:strand:- start:156 stop:311 length:156 start_codon:yes stop_codon:yes gene_type:complete